MSHTTTCAEQAKIDGVNASTIWRRRVAAGDPSRLRHSSGRKPKANWPEVNYARPLVDIAKELGVSQACVFLQRQRRYGSLTVTEILTLELEKVQF